MCGSQTHVETAVFQLRAMVTLHYTRLIPNPVARHFTDFNSLLLFCTRKFELETLFVTVFSQFGF